MASRWLAAAALAALAWLPAPLLAVLPAPPVSPVPPGFPPPHIPPDNPQTPEKVQLGRQLFFDTRLSATGRHACASCHEPARAFTDGRARATGALGHELRRNAMPLANGAWSPGYNWASPEVSSLEQQLLTPLLGRHPPELGMGGREAELVARLEADAALRAAFTRAFPGEPAPVSIDNLARALAAWQRSLVSANSPFDRLLFADDRDALDASARRGMALFYSARTGCAECHSGILLGGPVRSARDPAPRAFYANTGLYDVDGRGGYPPADQGLKELTGREEDNGRFRVPSLRDVALTAPYMHDGSIATLAAVIDHYDRGGRARRVDDATGGRAGVTLRDARIRPLGLTAQERADLEAFLHALTGSMEER